MFETINYIEAALWAVIGLCFLVVASRRSENRSRCVLLGIVFIAFGGSDVVEVQTGAWWRPWWLLAWKASCLAVMVEAAVHYVRTRSSDDKVIMKISDPVFGHMIYHESGLWAQVPATSGGDIGVTCDAADAGPSRKQRAFFQRLMSEMPELQRQAREYAHQHTEDECDIATLSPYSLEIGSDQDVDAERFVLELSDADQIIIHRVSFESGIPTAYTYDD